MYCRNPECQHPHEIIENPIQDLDGYEYPWYQQLCEECRIFDKMDTDDVIRLTGGV